MEMKFSKLGNYPRYTDIVFIGIETSLSTLDKETNIKCERIERYHVLNCKPFNGRLVKQSDITEFEGHDIFTSLLQYYQFGKRTLIVCNNSLVFLGSSDFIAVIESGVYDIGTGDMYGEQINEPTKDRISQQQFIASAPPTIVCLVSHQTNTEITIVDIANYGIKNIRKFFLDFDLDVISEFRHYTSRLLEVDKGDIICIAMYLVIRKYFALVHKHKLGGLALTYSGQGMRAYRSNHYENEITKHNDEQAAYVEEKCYKGGRAEARYTGKYEGKAYLLDINSYYPSIARANRFPKRLKEVTIGEQAICNVNDDPSVIYFAHCRIATQDPIFQYQSDGRIVYPIGEYDTYLCGEEFREAYQTGRITRIYYLAEYESGYILKSYADRMLSIRSEYKRNGDKVSETLLKFITNGLWGKFAEIGSRWIIDNDVHPTCRYGGFTLLDDKQQFPIQYRVIDGECSKLCRAFWTNNTFVPVTAVMNAYCRMQLWRYMLMAGLHNVLYCGIDSLIVTEAGKDNLRIITSDNPEAYGFFRVAESGDSCYIAGVGRYKIGNKVALSGIPTDDDFRYKGFWNCHDDRYIINSSKGVVRVQPTRRTSPSMARKIFGESATSQGYWEEPVRYYCSDSVPQTNYRREYQTSFRIDDFLQ